MKATANQQTNQNQSENTDSIKQEESVFGKEQKNKNHSSNSLFSDQNVGTSQSNDSSNSDSIGITNFSEIPIFSTKSVFLQPKLKINPSNDKYEQEADRIAYQVVHNPKPFKFSPTPIRTTTLQSKNASGIDMPINENFNGRLQSTNGRGEPLNNDVRSFMESRMGFDFSNVRIHNNPQAAQLNKDINANAFTIGNDIYFNAGHYSPSSATGKFLLAHELVHVGQQRNVSSLGAIQRKKDPAKDDNKESITIAIPKGTKTKEEFFRYAELMIFGKHLNIIWNPNSEGGKKKLEDPAKHVGAEFQFNFSKAFRERMGILSKEERGEADAAFRGLKGKERQSVISEINKRFTSSQDLAPGTQIKKGNNRNITLWNSFKRKVLSEKKKIENLPPAVKSFLHSDQTFTPENYEKLAEIADLFNQFDAGDFFDYKSKINFETTDLNALKESLANYLRERQKRKEEERDREQIKTKLNGLASLYKKYKEYKTSRSNAQMARQFGFGMDYSHGLFGSKKTREHRRKFEEAQKNKEQTFLKLLDDAGFKTVKEFESYIDKYEKAFRNKTLNIAKDHLQRYRNLLFEEEKKANDDAYLTKFLAEIKGSGASQHFDDSFNSAMSSAWAQGTKDHVSMGQMERSFKHAEKSVASKSAGHQAVKSLPSAGKLVKEIFFDREGISRIKSKIELKKFLLKKIAKKKESLRETWEDLNNNKERVYELGELLNLSKKSSEIKAGTIFDLIIKDKVKEIGKTKLLKAITFIVVGIALAVASFGTGAPAFLAGVASLGMSAFAVYEEIEKYKTNSNAYEVGLLANEPSLLWVVVAIIGAGLDVAAVGAAFKSAGIIAEAGTTFNKSAGTAKDLIKFEKELAKISDLKASIRKNIMRSAEAQAKGKKLLRSVVVPDGMLRSTIVPGGEEFAKLVAAAFHYTKKGFLDFDSFLRELKVAKVINDIGALKPGELKILKEAFSKGSILSRTKPMQDQVARLIASTNPDKFKVLNAMVETMAKGKIPEEDILGSIAGINRAGGTADEIADATRQSLSEINNARRIADEATGPVRINAKKGIDYDLGNGVVSKIDPMDEIDALFAKGSQVNAHEVKESMNALTSKIQGSQQLERMIAWRGTDAKKAILIVVENESKWTGLFSQVSRMNNKTVATVLGEAKVPLRIGQHSFSPAELIELNTKFLQYFKLKKLPPKDFFNLPELQNIASALKAIGFS